jgi:hypothetical protein
MKLRSLFVYAVRAVLSAALTCGQGVAQQDGSTSQVPHFALAPDSHGTIPQSQMQQLFRIVADKDMENEKRLRDYTYVQRSEEHSLDGKGNVKSTKSETSEVMELYGETVERKTEEDDKPLSAKDAEKEEERIRKLTERRKNESVGERRKRAEKDEKDREDSRKFELEVADAYNFELVGSESLDAREAWVVDAEPKAGYEPHMREAKFLPKFRGRVWIDKQDLQLSKLDVTCIDTVSLGWFLARIHKGTRVVFEQTRVNDEVWLPKHLTLKIDARLALLKEYNLDIDQTYRDYKKFRASSRIVDLAAEKTHE